MKKDVSKVKSIIEKYNISFKNEKEINKWINKLSDQEYNNLISLEIDPNEMTFDKNYLINKDLLNMTDYKIRVEAMSKIKCPPDCRHLLSVIVDKEFLNSKNYYLDMVLLSKAKHIRYCLWLLIDKNYKNNKHHIDDMSLVSKTEDALVAQVLSEVAMDSNSLQSKYHRKDMELISKCNPKLLQPTHQYPACSINNLAVNKESLQDPFHEENMIILANNKKARGYLYSIMTNPLFIYEENYRREIARLNKAKTKAKARAIYYFITNPERTCTFDHFDKMIDQEMNIDYSSFDRTKTTLGKNNKRYNFYLKLLNEIDDRYVMYISYLLSNKNLIKSEYLDQDIKLILGITNKKIFVDLFRLMQNEYSLKSIYHIEDANIISREENDIKRNLLLQAATNNNSLNSVNHRYDMYFITTLDLEKLSDNNYKALQYYLFDKKGINDINHIAKLESIYEQILNEEEVVLKENVFKRILRGI